MLIQRLVVDIELVIGDNANDWVFALIICILDYSTIPLKRLKKSCSAKVNLLTEEVTHLLQGLLFEG